MSSYCKQCSIKHFGEDFKDFAAESPGLISGLCEGCGGWIVTNEKGERLMEYPILHPITREPIDDTATTKGGEDGKV